MGWKLIAMMTLLGSADVAQNTPVEYLSPISNLSAVGVLAWTVWALVQELRSLRKRHEEVTDRICDRLVHLDATLRALTNNCARQGVEDPTP